MNPAKIEEEIILNLLKSVLTEKYRGGVKCNRNLLNVKIL